MSTRKLSEAFQVYGCIPPWIAWQQSQRAHVPEVVQSGINYSIILASACYVEGFLEKALLGITHEVQLGNSQLAERLLEELASRISATTGSDRRGGTVGHDTGWDCQPAWHGSASRGALRWARSMRKRNECGRSAALSRSESCCMSIHGSQSRGTRVPGGVACPTQQRCGWHAHGFAWAWCAGSHLPPHS